MRHPCHQPEHHRLDDREDRRRGAPRRSPGTEIVAVNPDRRPAEHRRLFRRGLRGSRPDRRDAEGIRWRAPASSPASTTPASTPRAAVADVPGGRHRRSRVPHGEPRRRQVQRRDDAVALGAGDRAQPRRATGLPAAAPGCAQATCRCSISKMPGSDARAARSPSEIDRAIGDDRAEAIVLGCAGMADLAADACREHGLPVLDGVACAVRLCESLVALGLGTSKRGGYQVPRGKSFAGIFAPFSPTGRRREPRCSRDTT